MLSHPQVPLTTIVAQQRWSDVYLYTASTFSRCRRLEHFLSRVYPSVRCQCVLPALHPHVNVRDFFAFQWKETHLMSQNTLMLELRKCLRSFELSKGVWIYFELDLKCWSVFGLGPIIYLVRIDPQYVNYRKNLLLTIVFFSAVFFFDNTSYLDLDLKTQTFPKGKQIDACQVLESRETIY